MDEYQKIEKTFSPIALNEISRWILNHQFEMIIKIETIKRPKILYSETGKNNHSS